jgi:Putative adhesin
MEGFAELAAGARELRVILGKGDIVVRVTEGATWNLEWSSDGDVAPEVEREGPVLQVRQPGHGGLFDTRVFVDKGHNRVFVGTGEFFNGEAGMAGTDFTSLEVGGNIGEIVTEALRAAGGVHTRRLDVRLTMPPGVEVVELRTGRGRIDAAGLVGRLSLTTGNGPLMLRSARGEAEVATGNGEVVLEGFDGTVTATTGNNRIQAERLSGTAALHTGNGRIEVRDCEGRIRATTGNGDVTLTAVAGDIAVDTGHGTVEISAPRSPAVRASTGMGSLRVEGGAVRGLRLRSGMGTIACAAALEPGTYEMVTDMGAIDLELPATIKARVDAQTSFGQIHSDFPLVRVGRSGPLGFGGVRMVGSIGEGEPEVHIALRSSKGQISLRRRPDSGAAGAGTTTERPAPAPPEEPTAAMDSTLVVLEALARGDISVDEADELLRR